ncbi:MAG: hypothetical protein LUC45_00030 [Paraprevotella sp.]|nr:hypothetical protein [Paraprevotella sp.]
MKKILIWMGCAFIGLSLLFSACKTGRTAQGVSDEAQRRFDYYYLEAVKDKLAGRYDDAFELYMHCLDIKPDAGEVLYDLGLYALNMGDSAKCEQNLTRAVALQPDNIYYKEALASFYLRNRNYKQASPVLEDMVKCNPTRSDVLAQLVGIYTDNGNDEAAIRALDRIETLDGRSLSVSMEKFRLYRDMKEDDNAFAELESLAKDNPNDLSYRVLIGNQYMLVQQPDKALAVYDEVRKKEPENQALRMSMLDYYKQTKQDSLYQVQLNDLLYGKGVDDKARAMLMRNYIIDRENAHADSTEILHAFDRMFSSVPETVDMLTLYVSYLQLKHMDGQVEPVLERILKLEPDNQGALLQLMQIYVRANDYPKVVDICTRGITHDPDQLPYYFYLGFSYYQLDRNDKALDVFRAGMKQIKPDTDKELISDMYSITGDLYYSNDLKDSAFAAYDSCLVYNPNNVGCLNNYAYYLSLEKKDLDKAEEMSHRTIVAEPDNNNYIDTYAWILFIKGFYAEAKLYIDRVLTGDIKNDKEVSGGVLEHAGDIYAKCGDMDGAMKYWMMAQEKGDDVSDRLKKKIQLRKYIEE